MVIQGGGRFSIDIEGTEDCAFEVVEVTGSEALGECFRFCVDMMSFAPDVSGHALLGKPAVLWLHPASAEGAAVPRRGMVESFIQSGRGHGGRCFYRVVLVPRILRLHRIRKSEVYVKPEAMVGIKTVCDVIDVVLGQGGLVKDVDYCIAFDPENYPLRAFTLQYEESNLDFLSRLLEREGIYSYFEHDGVRERLILVDDHASHPRRANTIRYCPTEKMVTPLDDMVFELETNWSETVTSVRLREFNYRQAEEVAEASAELMNCGDGENVLFGESLRTEMDESGVLLERRARIRGEELWCAGHRARGKSYVTGLSPGEVITLVDHFNAAVNGQYVVARVEHRGTQTAMFSSSADDQGREGAERTEYWNTLDLVPLSRQFRPARKTPLPSVAGVISAEIDSAGEGVIAHLDKYGRYKIRFHLDSAGKDKNAGKASAWVRMAVPFAGEGVGLHFPLCKGTEVVVGFEQGAPDRPVILGAVYNSKHPNVVLSGNGDELILHTGKGGTIGFNYVSGVVCFRGPDGSCWTIAA
ncbi:type VI secretion system Vgr family protein [Cupriavidus sp. D39]|uniref:type VI secretion system Vgr family protein n=1 Tax=Cupriavidus sp. D39 TaxID=2997877 RepID=UPI00226F925F|nr:type VI secretion system Vgr family protein [Cupriavidus sp. D39]MCY0858672.1 type VI secretion system Vgr family protein [Cupriavidus sp. D39]